MSAKKKILYAAGETPPLGMLVLSSLQHMLLVLSLGLAVPVAIARAAGLDAAQNATFLSITLFSIGITSILQSLPLKHLGTGYQNLSVSDSAAISACTMAVQAGGMPLVYGMTILSGVCKTVLASFTYRFRKLFPPEVTGSMIFILGISIIPTGLTYFLGGKGDSGTYQYSHSIIAAISFFIMLAFSLFLPKLKPYGVLAGIGVGFLLAVFTGNFDTQGFKELSELPLVGLPVLSNYSFAFDLRLVIPFLIVTVAAVVDNIGDYSATQRANDPAFQKPNWKSIENGIRASGIGSVLAGLMGGVIQSTATTNIGVAGATGVTSRKISYVVGGMLISLAFLPKVTGLMMLIPAPVLGATLLYSIAYIMAGGFSTLAAIELDDRRIFIIFVSITFAVSTLIPGLWDFLPPEVASILVSPMVMGTIVLLVMMLLGKIGQKKSLELESTMSAQSIPAINQQILDACKEWSAPKSLCNKLQIGVDAICEGYDSIGVTGTTKIKLLYDGMQVKYRMECEDPALADYTAESCPEIMALSLTMVKNMFDHVKFSCEGGKARLEIDADL